MGEPHIEIAEESYRRCSAVPGFFADFYDLLLASDARIPPMFAKTKFERQHKLLQHGLGLLLIYAKRPNPALLERIAVRHSRADVGVEPELYPRFVEALVQAVERCDPEFGPEVADAWRRAAEPGIAFMQAKF
jgi:hemoglobin-like flavoprotein